MICCALTCIEFARKGALLPLRVASLARQVVAQRGQVSLMDVLLGARRGAALRARIRARGSRAICRRCSSEPGRSDEFGELGSELYLTATDLDTCERIVFGADGFDDVPISTAVRASGALPMVYAPVEVKGRELIDGGSCRPRTWTSRSRRAPSWWW